jgi:DDE superfamily endonuclease
MHSVKNLIITALKDRLIKYLSQTYEGKKHDKKIVDDENITFPDDTFAFVDTAFQAVELGGAEIHIPTKKPKGGELSSHEKEINTLIASIRVVVEHVISGIKRLHIVKDVFRNTKDQFVDTVMEIACAVHNFRQTSRAATPQGSS